MATELEAQFIAEKALRPVLIQSGVLQPRRRANTSQMDSNSLWMLVDVSIRNPQNQNPGALRKMTKAGIVRCLCSIIVDTQLSARTSTSLNTVFCHALSCLHTLIVSTYEVEKQTISPTAHSGLSGWDWHDLELGLINAIKESYLFQPITDFVRMELDPIRRHAMDVLDAIRVFPAELQVLLSTFRFSPS
ncbi:hypothetical protein DL93DRAFT_2163142 [Clavulina sp. PMI_390]|nr:hypothetical protein DL93DRAFT_2163142 [Clavulina sp. PMI_390]